MRHIFFVCSFGSVYHRVLPLIEEKKSEGDVLVVVSNDKLYKFFKSYTTFDTVCLKVNSNLITKKDWYKAILNAIKSKIEYGKVFKKVKNDNVYFFGTGDAIVMFSYIQKLSNENRIFFYPNIENKWDSIVMPSIVENWKTKIICKAIKMLLGINVKVRKDCGLYRLCVYKTFFEQNKIQEVYKAFDTSIYKKYMKNIPIIENSKILVLISDLVSEGRVDRKTFENQMDELINVLDLTYPNQYVIKAHPNMHKLYGKMVNAPSVEPFIPSQFLMYHPWEFIIADCSAALVSPGHQGLLNTKLVEIIDILKFKDCKVQREMKEFLISWNPNLLFPQSFGELIGLLKNDKGKEVS